MKIAVIVSGGWGTALAVHLLANGHDVTLWSRRQELTDKMRQTRENPKLPGISLPEGLQYSSDPACVQDCPLVIMSAPSYAVRSACRAIRPYLGAETLLVSVTKGVEAETGLRMSEIMRQETGCEVVVLSGPSHAEEVAKGLPTGCVAACADQRKAELVQTVFMSPRFRVYSSPDVVGVELGGALKNVIALCAGICDGLGYGDNTKAMLMTRGLTEIARLGHAMGAKKDTFAGLAGIGDLIVTCTSMHSRNRRAGILIGQKHPVAKAMEEVGAVVEGYYAAKSAHELAVRLGAEMPITKAAFEVLYEGRDVQEAVDCLLSRDARPESEDCGWD
ncbi:MAG: NAD(P)-dependent glycerol-3-phosphate dehydrogenase [Oscillospiraceae bacterium]|nr:NAD(P)-dependent glycerol-3-phosphate dehydrogenase [Oscillospiraceae bacterium]